MRYESLVAVKTQSQHSPPCFARCNKVPQPLEFILFNPCLFFIWRCKQSNWTETLVCCKYCLTLKETAQVHNMNSYSNVCSQIQHHIICFTDFYIIKHFLQELITMLCFIYFIILRSFESARLKLSHLQCILLQFSDHEKYGLATENINFWIMVE